MSSRISTAPKKVIRFFREAKDFLMRSQRQDLEPKETVDIQQAIQKTQN